MFIAIISAKIAELIVSLGFAAVSTALIEILLYIRVADVLLNTAVLYLYSDTINAILGFIYMSISSVFALSFWL